MNNGRFSLEERTANLCSAMYQVLKHARKKLQKQQEELAESDASERYRQLADSLLAAPDRIKRGTTQAIILNIFTQKEETVQLNPKFDALQNAQLLHKKAKKGKRGAQACVEKVQETLESIRALEELIEKCSRIAKEPPEEQERELEQLELAARGFISPGASEGSSGAAQKREAAVPFRRMEIDGWEVYIGKNDEQNDELSVHFAKPSDVWLHVAAHAGSHVIIRRTKNAPTVPNEVLSKVASLAVWFSKAKHTSFAEVHFTEARYVHKRRGSPPGQVILDRYKELRVSPKSPHDLFPSMYDKE